MSDRYPKLQNSLTFRKTDNGTVEVTDILTEEKNILSPAQAAFAKKLDGHTHPYRIPTQFSRNEIDALLEDLDERKLLKTSDTRLLPRGTVFHALWEPEKDSFLHTIAPLWNKFLPILCLPVLVVGILAFLFRFREFGMSGMLWGAPIGFVLGLLLHEFSHFFAASACGASVKEMGVMLQYAVLPGIYTLIDDSPVTNRRNRMQIHGAGMEMNLLLTGLFLILGAIITPLGGVCLMASAVNGILAIMNLLLLGNTDGSAVLTEALGTDNLLKRGEFVVRNKKFRRKLMKAGEAGIGTVILYYILFGMRYVLPLLLITNILEVILWLV